MPAPTRKSTSIKHLDATDWLIGDSNSNGSQFFITTVVTSWLNGRHVVFGEVDQDCLGIVSALEATGRDDGKVKYEPRPTITASGVL